MAGIVILLFLMALYFLPTLVCLGKRQVGGVFVVNFFLGWTFIGWVVALAWAMC